MQWDNTSFADIVQAVKAKKWWIAAVAGALVLGWIVGKVL